MKKIICSITLFLFCSISVYSQKNNSIYFTFSDNWYRGNLFKMYDPFEQYGFGFTHVYKNKITINAEITQWYWLKLGELSFYRYEDRGYNIKNYEKMIHNRRRYKFFDLCIGYNIFNNKKWGCLNAQLGATYTWGKNSIVDTVMLPPEPPYHVTIVLNHIEKANYLGIVSGLKYNYYLFKQRVHIGIHIKARKYFASKQPYKQTEQGIHLGYNF